MTLSSVCKRISVIVWCFMIFCYYFQVPFKLLSSYIIPLLFLYIVLSGRILNFKGYFKDTDKLIIFYFVFICLSSLISLLLGVMSTKILRFASILIAIPVAFFVRKKDFKWEYRVFIALSIIKSVYLIVIAIQMKLAGTFAPFRLWAEQNDFGDAYFVYNIIPRIQLYGNPLLMTGFMVYFHNNRKVNLINIILFSGILIAGNFAFILGLALFFLYEYISSKKRNNFISLNRFFATIVLIILSVGFLYYANLEMSRKAKGGNALKIKQAQILVDTNLVFGRGIGASVPRNEELTRNPDAIYYELQTLYIFYQIGIIGILLYYFTTLYMCRSFGIKIFMLYIIYNVYSFFNPYCFDSTQMITIIILINLNSVTGKKNGNRNYLPL